jgi:kynureninase
LLLLRAPIDEEPSELSVALVGAKDKTEVTLMNSLSCNLHLFLLSFYRPTNSRFKIFMEQGAFCSDQHIIQSQIEYNKLNTSDALITIAPRSGESSVRTEDILSVIEKQGLIFFSFHVPVRQLSKLFFFLFAGQEIAVVLFPGVQFYTGQAFEMDKITEAAHKQGCFVRFRQLVQFRFVVLCYYILLLFFSGWV